MNRTILTIAAAGIFTATVTGGCSFLQGVTVEPSASVTVWHGHYGIRTQYVNADSTCITALYRADTTAGAPVTTIAGPACFDAYSYVRSFFPADTTQDEIPDAPTDTPVPGPITGR